MKEIGVGIIGAGIRGVYCLGKAIVELYAETGLVVNSVYDVLTQRSVEAKQFLEGLYQGKGMLKEIRVYDHYRKMLAADDCRIVLITNFTNEHKSPAVEALCIGKKVYLDKPISTTLEDAAEIVKAGRENPLIMGFTRRYEKAWVKAKELLDSGLIGDVQMMEIQSVIPYSRYLQTWHRKKELSGGSLNDKCSHHFDVFNWMTGEFPEYLTATGGRSSFFKVEEDAPESCRKCSRECEYRRDPNRISDGSFVLNFDSWKNAEKEIEKIDNCVYAPGADINDHALVSLAYPSGVKASLFFAIFGPNTKDQEKLLLVGEKGKIIVNRHEGSVTLYSDFGRKEEVFDCRGEEFETSHFGADRELIRKIKDFYNGKKPIAAENDGYKSLEIVLAAQQSIINCGQPVRFGMPSGPAV